MELGPQVPDEVAEVFSKGDSVDEASLVREDFVYVLHAARKFPIH